MLARLLIACLLLLPLAHADAPLRIGTLAIAPYGYLDASGEPDGALYRLANRIAEQAGQPYENALYPTARLYAMLERRRLDLAMSSRDLTKDMGLVQLARVWQLEGQILYRKALPIQPTQATDFRPYLVGRLNGTCPPLQRAGVPLYTVGDLAQGLRMLAVGRIQGLCGDAGALGQALRSEPAAAQQLAPPLVFLRADVHLYANPELPAARQNLLREAALQLARSGETARLMAGYLGADSPYPREKP
ncbi:substrate-binding periplasmic protein [Chitinimonas koreensis]|uniref:substrate-binding periplasmic protein n=1 Tax=Chitinimonas koreensis TaxID=356302 RepID=UPI0004096EDE|nr:transporter substrate-binding domain-containing protein [Chitinimonas koreensis]QNM95858.1 transporter substrate-binding domain-containing protein [Chitinimonas koreensis]